MKTQATMLRNFGIAEICFSVVTFLLAWFYLRLTRKNGKLPPGPTGLPLVGYVPFMGKHPPSKYYELSKKYGPVLSTTLGTDRVVVLNDYDVIQEALVKKGDVFSGRPKLHVFEIITKGFGIIFRTFDATFKSQRKFALTTLRGFGFGKRSMEARITEEIEYFAELLQSKKDQSFDCQRVLSISVSNVMCSVAMGSRFSYDDEVFRDMVERLSRGATDKKNAVYVTLMIFAPFIRHFPPFRAVYSQLLDDVSFVLEILRNILEEHKKTLDPENPRDYIDKYLNEMSRRGDRDPSFNEYQLFITIRDFFLAGTETTTSTLRWCILLLAQKSEIQDKLFTEMKEVIGEAVPAMQFKEKMPYTSAFLHEMTRHRTLVPLSVPHCTTADVVLLDYHIPKDTLVLPNILAVHHDPNYFQNPYEFRPERFIDENGRFVPDKRVMPFSVGPRYCLGEQLATMELFLFLTNIIQRFEIVADPEKPLPDFNTSIAGLVEVPLPYEVSFKART